MKRNPASENGETGEEIPAARTVKAEKKEEETSANLSKKIQ